MDEQKRKQRQEAAKAFMASLDDELQDIFKTDEASASAPASTAAKKQTSEQKQASQSQNNLDLDAFEEAVADIDAFLEKKQSQS